jgi:CRISPR-associated protein (Cas_Cas02710)
VARARFARHRSRGGRGEGGPLSYPGPLTVPLSFRAALEAQLGFLRQLVAADRDRKAFVLAVYALAADYARRERYDFATLLYYRTLEGCFAEQLARVHTIDVSAFDRGALGERADDVEGRFRELVTKVTGSANVTALPARIGCFEAFMLLRALDDPMMQEAKLWEPRSLGGLQRLLVSRNKSILAHGFDPVSAKSCDQFHAQAEHVLRAALNVWEQQNLEVELRPATFAQLGVGV